MKNKNMMKTSYLHSFFAGKSTEIEKQKLRLWLESDPSHKEIFLKERRLYNIALLHFYSDSFSNKKPGDRSLKWRKMVTYFLKTAAIFLLAILSFYWLNSRTDNQMLYQTISVPFGQRINLILPDGSRVFLNAGTTIKYPVSFNKKIREVELNGEAYFEVAQTVDIPFRVLTGRHIVEVLGTKFNVEADSSGNIFKTSLLEGAVKVFDHSFPDKSVIMKPNTIVYLANGNLHQAPLMYSDYFRWKEGILCFEKERFEKIMNTFEKSYGCKIQIRNTRVREYLYTGKFQQSDGIDYALNLLQKSISFSYSRDKENNNIVIY